MHRCLSLARLGAGYVAPNPMVGAVLVHDDRIIGEGWHQEYGGPHAEVNCIGRAVENGLADLIADSTLYVSLEPCAHFGKTPPCTDLIIRYKIPRVVIGCQDPFKEVDGKGIDKLKEAGVEVVTGILEQECKTLNKRFFTFHTLHRPYVILKWAQTKDGFIGTAPAEGLGAAGSDHSVGETRLLISNEYTNRLVHQWRSEEAAILVGTNTALYDNPGLTTRLWPGASPVRLVVDRDLRLPGHLKLFDGKTATIVFNSRQHNMEKLSLSERAGLGYYQVTPAISLVHQIMNALYQLKIQSVLVEGGARLIQSFIDEGIWDEIRKIENPRLPDGQGKLKIPASRMGRGSGIPAPVLPVAVKVAEQPVLDDTIAIYKPAH